MVNEAQFVYQFKFLNICTLDKHCHEIIARTWATKIYGFPMYILDKNLRLLKAKLKNGIKVALVMSIGKCQIILKVSL